MTKDARTADELNRPAQALGRRPGLPRPEETHRSERVMLSDFDYLSVAQDIIARSDAEELEFLDAAIQARREELGLEVPTTPHEGASKDPVSQVVERRAHEDGELVNERRAYVRKDGTRTWRGPYWYFHTREGSRQKTIYLGKTDNPEAKLQEKRTAKQDHT